MPKCSFCGEEYDSPKGITIVQKDGNPSYYCSSKCRKNAKLGRDKRKVKWIKKKKTDSKK